MRRVIIVHPFVPAYRRALYTALSAQLARDSMRLTVVWNTPPPRVAARNDVIRERWATPVAAHWITIAGRDIGLRRLHPLRLRPSDLVIVEQAVKNLDTYPLLWRASRGPRVAMWGHGRTYCVPQPRVIGAFKQWLTRRSDWFFAYTDAGARHVIERGFPPDRVTVVTNTVDTDGLQRALSGVRPADVADLRSKLRLTPGRTALFVGGVDEAKGIGFLLESARIAETLLPGFVLLVAGAGSSASAVQRLERAGGPVRWLGRVDGAQKALALTASDLLAIPQWIGLIAVDSLVSGRPIVTTRHRSHAPEAEYLTDGRTCVFAAHEPTAYARALTDLLRDEPRRLAMGGLGRGLAPAFALDRTVTAFADGVRRWAGSRG